MRGPGGIPNSLSAALKRDTLLVISEKGWKIRMIDNIEVFTQNSIRIRDRKGTIYIDHWQSMGERVSVNEV